MNQTPGISALATDDERRKIINRLKRLEGQVRGLQTMIESDKDCESVLTQIMAAKSALNQVGLHIIGHSMKTCLVDDSVKDRDELIDEAIKVFLKYSSCVQ
ncbi:MAG: metal-sensitive transcriptional regulator [Coriobacteriia bacterium]|nr:metal-sensitive transcriptional regulator [Coriobacteriia bacterium]MBN2841385.1 metal-sensitive transcriptional regulator [Coriobacteriia bacterium]